MGLQIYKPNSSKTGSACNFTFVSKVGNKKGVFLEIVRQSDYNQQTRAASFKGGKTRLKFNVFEMGGLLHFWNTAKDGDKHELVHTSEFDEDGSKVSFVTKISFSKSQWKNEPIYGLIVNKTNKTNNSSEVFKIHFNQSEVVAIDLWIRNALRHIFDGIYSEDLQSFQGKKTSII